MVGGMIAPDRQSPASSPAEEYDAAALAATRQRDAQARRSRWVSIARLVTFLSAAALVAWGASNAGSVTTRAAIGVGAAGFAAFFGLVYYHSRVDAAERWAATLATVNTEAAARVRRHWNALSQMAVDAPGPEHPFAGDLDVFGHASLFQLLGWVGTEAGRATLARWLSTGATPLTIRRRQAAVAELALLTSYRVEFATLGRLVEPTRRDLEAFFEWAEQGAWLTTKPWLVWLSRLVPALTIGLLAAQVIGVVDRPLWLYGLLPALCLFGGYGKRLHATFGRAFSRERLFQQHATLFARIADAPWTAPHLQALQAELKTSGVTAAAEMRRLSLIRQYADLRFVTLFHFVIGVMTLWDFHVLFALERWQVRNAAHLRRWFEALGECDALASLAALAADNPAWAFPVVDEQQTTVDAVGLGHPLIPAERRVANDLTVGPPGTFVMVTGSNMSGKSTLLRALGLNVVLAQAGGPVCAQSMTLPPVAVCTSMRVQDSLEQGVSYFMAALKRLAFVVSGARATGAADPIWLYLLDEVLQGTNTAERQIAVRHILAHLLTLRAIGVVTTHDLELAECEELSTHYQPVHFAEGVDHEDGDIRLTFDYRLQPGVASSRNALKLVRLVGLE